jgi:D-glycero-alpha-D-manno-heptose-7-phosphate kinase
MIIVQTPLRISLFGGGTDFAAYYRAEGGCVLSTAIDKYIFLTIKPRFDDKIRVGYTRTEIVDQVDEVQHELIREALRKTRVRAGVEITTMGDIPAGSGLSSSSAVTVGALHAMYAYQNEIVPAERLAQEACEVEIKILGKPIGKQDQYIATYGGFRFIEFHPDESVSCESVSLEPRILQRLNENLLLFYTGVNRQAETILAEQEQNIGHHLEILHAMKQLAFQARDMLCAGDIDAVGYLLDESWQLKKQLASQISNPEIERVYQTALEAGALGGKIAGAGGGGFLLLYCPPGQHESVRTALGQLKELPFRFEPDGTKVIFNYPH